MAYKPQNPFLLTNYVGPAYFCDRENETERLISHCINGAHTTLIADRRMGKTGLLKHVAHHLKLQGIKSIYLDVYATQNLREFAIELLSAIYQTVPPKTGLGKKFIQLLQNLRATLSFDPVSGHPQISLDYKESQQYIQSMSAVFQLLEQQKQCIVVMIDEFQQLATYPEKTMEAVLRTQMQQLQYTRFIFSGSNKHLLSAIFGDHARPFYNSTQWVELHPIDATVYSQFIRHHFEKNGKGLSDEVIQEILRFSRRHTYYTQAVCNRLYATQYKQPDLFDLASLLDQMLDEQQAVFLQYRQLLTSLQWRLLEAIALEEKVHNPTAKKFIKKYDLGATSAIQRALAALVQKEMIFKSHDDAGYFYQVYDCFLSRWLEKSSYISTN